MSFEDYYFDDDSNYNAICNSTDPKNVDCVSMLRHYMNCYGITNALNQYLGLADYKGDIEDVYDTLSSLPGHTTLHKFKNKDELDKFLADDIACYDRKMEAIQKNQDLIIDFKYHQQDALCNGVGVYRTKLFLNKKIKEGDNIALAYRNILEAEHKNIDAKNTYGKYREKIYAQKSQIIIDLIKICQDNDFVFGVEETDNYSADHIVYFELPHMEQVSFHATLSKALFATLPKYGKSWDGLVNSTIGKIESAINEIYGAELKAFNDKVEESHTKRELAKQKKLEKIRLETESNARNQFIEEIDKHIKTLEENMKCLEQYSDYRFKPPHNTVTSDAEHSMYIFNQKLEPFHGEYGTITNFVEVFKQFRKTYNKIFNRPSIPNEMYTLRNDLTFLNNPADKEFYENNLSMLEMLSEQNATGVITKKGKKTLNRLNRYSHCIQRVENLKEKYPDWQKYFNLNNN